MDCHGAGTVAIVNPHILVNFYGERMTVGVIPSEVLQSPDFLRAFSLTLSTAHSEGVRFTSTVSIAHVQTVTKFDQPSERRCTEQILASPCIKHAYLFCYLGRTKPEVAEKAKCRSTRDDSEQITFWTVDLEQVRFYCQCYGRQSISHNDETASNHLVPCKRFCSPKRLYRRCKCQLCEKLKSTYLWARGEMRQM